MSVGHRLVFRGPQVGQQRRHLIEGPPAHGFMISAITKKKNPGFKSTGGEAEAAVSIPAPPVAGEVLADPLLVVPQQAVEGQDVAVADEGQAVVDRVAGRRVRSDVQEKPAAEGKNV